MNDLFHGEGVMRHASGIYYRGLWVNGFPEMMASKLVIVGLESPLVLGQGQAFSIKVECRDDDDVLINGKGYIFKCSIGINYNLKIMF